MTKTDDKYEAEAKELVDAICWSDTQKEADAVALSALRSCAEAARKKAFKEAAKVVKNTRLELPEEPDRAWMHGFTVAQESLAAMLLKLASLVPAPKCSECGCPPHKGSCPMAEAGGGSCGCRGGGK